MGKAKKPKPPSNRELAERITELAELLQETIGRLGAVEIALEALEGRVEALEASMGKSAGMSAVMRHILIER
jgi:hypothetical protein